MGPLVLDDTSVCHYRATAVDRTRVLKGVGELFGKHTAEQNARGGVSEDEMFRRMGEWGFDHCRYAFAFHADWDLPLVRYMGGPLIEDNEAMWRRLDELVDKCNDSGMMMMLCWFFNEDSPQRDAGGAVRNSTRYWQLKPETKQNAFALWRRIAERYKDRPQWAIAYDFFNEPAYMNRDHWNEIVKDLTQVIRAVDKTHLIVWESADGWAQPQWSLWLEPSGDPNTLYSFHHYGKHWGYAYDEYYPSYQCTRERTQYDMWLEAILFGIRNNVPIHCGEFGISIIQPDLSGTSWLEDYLGFFDRFGIGWNWWNYSGSDIYRTGLAAGNRISPNVEVLKRWTARKDRR
jgi:aryl-phospho-beta-D-glucosidase BglC (GH1 family)